MSCSSSRRLRGGADAKPTEGKGESRSESSIPIVDSRGGRCALKKMRVGQAVDGSSEGRVRRVKIFEVYETLKVRCKLFRGQKRGGTIAVAVLRRGRIRRARASACVIIGARLTLI